MINFESLLIIKNNFVPKDIINIILDSKFTEFAMATSGTDQQISDYRKTKWINYPQKIRNHLVETIYQIHEEVLKPVYNSTLLNIEPPNLLRYDVGDRYKPHNDCEDLKTGSIERVANRDISILFYLNEDFEGGELFFPQQNFKIRPTEGMLVAFPSYFEFTHEVLPITRGSRYTIASWIETENTIYERPYQQLKSFSDISRKWVLSS